MTGAGAEAGRTAERDSRVHAAARNNAEWCEAVCRAHGSPGVFGDTAWTQSRRTPPLYPDAVTLSPAASAAEILARIDTTSPGCSVKDSFGTLDLSGAGFDVLFEAEWIHRPPGPAPRHPDTDRTGVRWDVVRDADALAAWAAAWSGASGTGGAGGGPFRPELLGDGRTFVLRGRDGDRVVAGAVASRSAQAVGLSNVFAADGGSGAAWAGALGAVSERWPGLPVVGYESGEDLAAAVAHGCLPVGPLRVWLATDR